MTTTTTTAKPVCYKCWGTGRVSGCSHVASGICFACDGTGKQRVSTGSLEGTGDGLSRTARFDDCHITYIGGMQFEVYSVATQAKVMVYSDGEAFATNSVPKHLHAKAEAWALRAVQTRMWDA